MYNSEDKITGEYKYEITESKKWHYNLTNVYLKHKYKVLIFHIVVLLILFILFVVGSLTMTEI